MTQARTHALAMDAADPLRPFRNEFLVPKHRDREQVYFVGNSLGLQPRGARAHVLEVLDKWAAEAVEGHFTGATGWMDYHALVREPLARLVGAQPGEVVAGLSRMNWRTRRWVSASGCHRPPPTKLPPGCRCT